MNKIIVKDKTSFYFKPFGTHFTFSSYTIHVPENASKSNTDEGTDLRGLDCFSHELSTIMVDALDERHPYSTTCDALFFLGGATGFTGSII